MSFFEKPYYSERLTNSITLFPNTIILRFLSSKRNDAQKRTSPCAFTARALMSLEAAILLPLFLSACLMILYFGETVRLQNRINELLYDYGRVYAQYVGLIRSGEKDSSALMDAGLSVAGVAGIAGGVRDELGEDFYDTLHLSARGMPVSFGLSRIGDDYVDLVATYAVGFRLPFLHLPAMQLAQRCRIHAWTGNEETETGDPTVYVTAHGRVYHWSRDCPYLNPSIRSVSLETVEELRNVSGAKYVPCESCSDKACSGVLYVTDYGTSYHRALTCSTLRRIIREVRLSEVAERMRPCGKCGGGV